MSIVYEPTITVDTSAYASGDAVDGILTLTGVVQRNAILNDITIIDVDNEGVQFDFIFFNAETSGTYDDNEAAAIDAADVSKVVGQVSVGTGYYITVGTDKIAARSGILKQFQRSATGNLWVLPIVRGAPTFAAATNIRILFGFINI